MKRLMIGTALLLTMTLSVWAETPAADANKPEAANPALTMPMANCPGRGGEMAQAPQGCPMAPARRPTRVSSIRAAKAAWAAASFRRRINQNSRPTGAST